MKSETKAQQIQEEQYALPYHWFFDSADYRGRKYFGYIDICIKYAKKSGMDKSARILDAGCGDGRLIKALYDAGCSVADGLDYSERAISFAKIFFPRNKFHIADLTDYNSLKHIDQYDVIFFIETLEHIPIEKVSLVLRNLSRMLKQDGHLIITVPSVMLPLNKKHYQHFSKAKLLEEIDPYFEVVAFTGYANLKKYVLNIVYKFLDNRFWLIKPVARWFNLAVYPKYLNECTPNAGAGLLAVCKNKGTA